MMETNASARQGERGIALLITLFTVLLLSVIALGMMVSTGTETTINSNYRDKQSALFAAMGGLQEARDRIQPATHHIVAPTDIPSLSAANVIYVINPKSGETIAPWDMSASNKYRDTELCQENVLGLTGTFGVHCTTIASGSSWYSVVDNSLTASAPWNLASPLDVKWTRITLKGNNMTPVAASGDGSNSTQVCWDGAHQILRPAGYGPNCSPDGSVALITITNGGTGYSSIPTLTLSAPPSGGIQATATAVTTQVPTDAVAQVTVSAPGTGYTSAPTVTLSGGGGTGATAVAITNLFGAPVDSLNLTAVGTRCYTVPPTVAITGGGGSGATALTTLASVNSCVAGWTVTGSCNSKKGETVTDVGLSGGGGSGFSGSISFASGTGTVTSQTIQNPGTGYTGNPTSITNLSGCPSLTFTPSVGRVVNTLSLLTGGAGYTTTPTVSFTTGTGTAATQPAATATLGPQPASAGEVQGVTVTSGGSGYTSAPTVTFSGGGGSGATATSGLGITYSVTGATINNPGRAYTVNPTVTITAPPIGGTQATATAAIGRGPDYGSVYLLTSLAQTASGARAMAQMEVSTPVRGFSALSALLLDGPNPVIGSMPNSFNFEIHGADANTCSETPDPLHPAIGGYDDPNADPPTNSVATIISELPNPTHYTGYGGAPSVHNVFGGLGDTMSSPIGLEALTSAVQAAGTTYGNDPGSINLGTPTIPAINYVDGDLTLNGSSNGYGVLVVTGTLHFGGNFSWHGVVLVVGDGNIEFNGGGNGSIYGTVIVAKIWDNNTNKNLLTELGSPSIDWNGGGGNSIFFDHCWAQNMMHNVPFTPPHSTKPLKILSFKALPY